MKRRLLPLTMAVAVAISTIPTNALAAATPDTQTTMTMQSGVAMQAQQDVTGQVTVYGAAYDYLKLADAQSTADTSAYTQIGDTLIYYKAADDAAASALEKTYYGTATLDYTDYYANDTSKESYDAMSSATTAKYSIFPNEAITEVTESGYDITGVKNVNVAASAKIVTETQILQTTEALPDTGVYKKAAEITWNEAVDTPTAQYKILQEDGTYTATVETVADTVTDAKLSLNTNSIWGDYELDVTETSTSHIRNSREDTFDINSQIQGVIVGTTEGTEVGLRYTEEIWVQPYELAFSKASELVGKHVNSITYRMPDSTYVYQFADAVYIKPQASEAITDGVSAKITSSKTLTLDGISQLENPSVTVYYKEGRTTTYYAQDVAVENGAITLTTPVTSGTYTVVVDSDNYASIVKENQLYTKSLTESDVAVSVASAKYTYTGKAQTPAVTVKDGTTALKAGTDYTVSYANNVNAGTATITIAGKGNYTGTVKKTFTIAKASQTITVTSSYAKVMGAKAFTLSVKRSGAGAYVFTSSNKKVATVSAAGKVTIKGVGTAKVTVYAKATTNYNQSAAKTITITVKPKASSVSSVKGAKKAVTVKWKKVSGVTGYQVQYSTSSKFKSVKTVTVKGAAKVTTTVKKLSAKKKYYVRVRTYQTSSGKNYYSSWSAVKSVKTK